MNKPLKALHRLFDPTVMGRTAQVFSLQYPPDRSKPEADLLLHTDITPPTDSPLTRLGLRASSASEQVDEALALAGADVPADLPTALGLMKQGLHAERGSDIVTRQFELPFTPPVRACLVYIDGVVDSHEVELAVLTPLLHLPRGSRRREGADLLDAVEKALLPARQTIHHHHLREALDAAVSGQLVLLLDGVASVVAIEGKKFPGRSVEAPLSEAVIRGPQEAFTEDLRTNTGLIRRRLMSPDLVFEPFRVGRRSRTFGSIAYLGSLVNQDLLAEIRRRLAPIDIDSLAGTGQLEQFIEDSPTGLFPTILSTERTDRVSAALSEGRAAILLNGSPYALVVPAVLSDLLHNPEDYYIKWPFGSLLRAVRVMGLMFTLILPSLYIAIANFHHEMIPSSLLLAIAASREAVPFPAFFEVLMMELAFEIIREGSLRVPSRMGQTIGIVGALILGQAAVQAAIVSPILVIIVATTALGSFTILNYNMSLTFRSLRFVFIALAASFGLYGLAAGLFVLTAHATSLRSFGVPFMAPYGPSRPGSPDALYRGTYFQLWRRPAMVQARDEDRQAPDSAGWNPSLRSGDAPTKGGNR